jgi:hypothetical protein
MLSQNQMGLPFPAGPSSRGTAGNEVRYNPRYLAYCKAHGKIPNAMMMHDEQRFPGGCMAGYILWIGGKWAEWKKVTGNNGPLGNEHYTQFDEWLQA